MSIKNIFNVKNNIKFTSKMILIKNESLTLQLTSASKQVMVYGKYLCRKKIITTIFILIHFWAHLDMWNRCYKIAVVADYSQIFICLPQVSHSWAIKINHTVKICNHYLISDQLLSPFGLVKQKLQHLSIRQFWPKLQTTTAHKPLMC